MRGLAGRSAAEASRAHLRDGAGCGHRRDGGDGGFDGAFSKSAEYKELASCYLMTVSRNGTLVLVAGRKCYGLVRQAGPDDSSNSWCTLSKTIRDRSDRDLQAVKFRWSSGEDGCLASAVSNEILIQDCSSGSVRNRSRLETHAKANASLDWHPLKPDILVSSSLDGGVKIWDVRSGGGKRVSLGGVSSAAVSTKQAVWERTEGTLLSTLHGSTVKVWDARRCDFPHSVLAASEVKNHLGQNLLGFRKIVHLDFHPSRRNVLAAGCRDSMVALWKIDSGSSRTKPSSSVKARAPGVAFRLTQQPQCDVVRVRQVPFGYGVVTLSRTRSSMGSPRGGGHPNPTSNSSGGPAASSASAATTASPLDDTSLTLKVSKFTGKLPAATFVHRFRGHSDAVLDYDMVAEAGNDNRFQLISWGKDNVLKVWPVNPALVEACQVDPYLEDETDDDDDDDDEVENYGDDEEAPSLDANKDDDDTDNDNDDADLEDDNGTTRGQPHRIDQAEDNDEDDEDDSRSSLATARLSTTEPEKQAVGPMETEDSQASCSSNSSSSGLGTMASGQDQVVQADQPCQEVENGPPSADRNDEGLAASVKEELRPLTDAANRTTITMEYRVAENVVYVDVKAIMPATGDDLDQQQQQEPVLTVAVPAEYPREAPTFAFHAGSVVDREKLDQVVEAGLQSLAPPSRTLRPLMEAVLAEIEEAVNRESQEGSREKRVTPPEVPRGRNSAIPFPRFSGARFSGNGLQLVCFGLPFSFRVTDESGQLTAAITPRALSAMIGEDGTFVSSPLLRNSSRAAIASGAAAAAAAAAGQDPQETADRRMSKVTFEANERSSKGLPGKTSTTSQKGSEVEAKAKAGSSDYSLKKLMKIVNVYDVRELIGFNFAVVDRCSLQGLATGLKSTCQRNGLVTMRERNHWINALCWLAAAASARSVGPASLLNSRFAQANLVAMGRPPILPTGPDCARTAFHPVAARLLTLASEQPLVCDLQTSAGISSVLTRFLQEGVEAGSLMGTHGPSCYPSYPRHDLLVALRGQIGFSVKRPPEEIRPGALAKAVDETLLPWETSSVMRLLRTSVQEMRRKVYSELLRRNGMLVSSISVSNLLSRAFMPNHAAEDFVIHHRVRCGRCFRFDLDEGDCPSCSSAQQEAASTTCCVVCRMTVKGHFVVCLACGHGGHLKHMMEWFGDDLLQKCPASCECRCLQHVQ